MRLSFTDESLFRQAALVGERWIEADPSNAIEVNDPASGKLILRGSALGPESSHLLAVAVGVALP